MCRTSLAKDLQKKQLEPLFIDGLLEEVLVGAETGLVLRGFEEAESDEGVLQRTQLFKVDKARETLNYTFADRRTCRRCCSQNAGCSRA